MLGNGDSSQSSIHKAFSCCTTNTCYSVDKLYSQISLVNKIKVCLTLTVNLGDSIFLHT